MTTSELIEHIEIAAPPARVFAALTTPQQLAQWWGAPDMYRTSWRFELRVNAKYLCTATAGDGTEMTVQGDILAVDPPRHLAYTWNASWDSSGETRVDYHLTPIAGGTLVRVIQTGFGPTADHDGYRDGWGRILAWLAAFVISHPDSHA